MKLFLDSSAIIEFFRGNLETVTAITSSDEIYTSSICAYEVLVGERFVANKKSKQVDPKIMGFFNSIAILPFSYDEAIYASKISCELILKGNKINDLDILIAAQAISKDATVLTKNVKHFAVLSKQVGLRVKEIN